MPDHHGACLDGPDIYQALRRGRGFPRTDGIVRAVFDTARALETRTDDPAGYLKMLQKKISKLRKAAAEFTTNAPIASGHTNFQQAVISINACVTALEQVLADSVG